MKIILKVGIKIVTNEPIGLMCGKVAKIIPHIPYYLADGNTLVKKWKEEYTDHLGNEATLTKAEFLTKKGKLNEAVVQVLWK